MNVEEWHQRLTCAWKHSLLWKKNIWAFFVLFGCGLFALFCQALTVHANAWMSLSLHFVPFFFCTGILLSSGILFVRAYQEEKWGNEVSYPVMLQESPEIFLAASYFSIPLILFYLLIWVFQGIFLLLTEIPGIGNLVGVLFSFAPFLLNLITLMLCAGSALFLFLLTPTLSFHGLQQMVIVETLAFFFRNFPLHLAISSLVGSLPLLGMGTILCMAKMITSSLVSYDDAVFLQTLQNVVLLIPSAALMAPALLFFFHFSSETYQTLQAKYI